jgi:hypothetical protein
VSVCDGQDEGNFVLLAAFKSKASLVALMTKHFCLIVGVVVCGAVGVDARGSTAVPMNGWEQTTSLRSSVGWRDNGLLSSFAPIGRGFGRAEIETFLTKGQGDWRWLAFVNGDVLRYFSPPPETGGEQQWFLHGEARWQHGAA